MQRHHIGSGRRSVIPADWSAHHRPILAGTRDATVTLRRPGGTGGTFDRASGTYVGQAPNAAYYTGPARIQVLPAIQQETQAVEQEISTLAYAVMLNFAVGGIQLDDLVKVTAMDDNGDAEMVDAELQVSLVEGGSLHWERRLIAVLDLEPPAA